MTIYLDNAATSFPKPESVYRAVDQTQRFVGANPGRGGHRLAVDASRLVFSAREAVADFFSIADASRIAFTGSATEAINIALFGLLQPGDRVVTSTMEHNSVTRPLRTLQDRGVEVVKVAPTGADLSIPLPFAGLASKKPAWSSSPTAPT
jgi:selenocysteine lyase/cysteine desulfurase